MSEKKRAWLYYHGASSEQDLTQLKPWTADLFEYAERMEYEIVGMTFSMRSDLRPNHRGLEFIVSATEDGIMDVLLVHDYSSIDRDIEKGSEFIRHINELGVEVASPNNGS